MIYDKSQIFGRDEYSAGQELVRELNARRELSRSYEIRLPHFVNDILKCGLGIPGLEYASALEDANWPRLYADKWLYGATKSRFGRTLTDAEVKQILLDGNDFSVPGDRYRAFVALNKLLGEAWCAEQEIATMLGELLLLEIWDITYEFQGNHKAMKPDDESTWWTDVETVYEKAMEIAGERWLKEFMVEEKDKWTCSAYIRDNYYNIPSLHNTWCVRMNASGTLNLRIPYRIVTRRYDDKEQDYTLFTGGKMQGCKHELPKKETMIKGVENSEGLRFSRGGLSLDAGTLIKRTGGLIKLTQTREWKDAYNGFQVREYKSKVLYPEFESKIGITMMRGKMRANFAEQIIANGGTVPGYAG